MRGFPRLLFVLGASAGGRQESSFSPSRWNPLRPRPGDAREKGVSGHSMREKGWWERRGLSAEALFSAQLQRELAVRGAEIARRSAAASAEAAHRLRVSGSTESAFTEQLQHAMARGSAAALHAALQAAHLDEPLDWASPGGRIVLSAAGAVLQPQVHAHARSLRVLSRPGLVDSETISRLGIVVLCNISDVAVTGLDSLLTRPELAPDGGVYFKLSSALGKLRASASVSAELRLSLLGGRTSRPLVRSQFKVVAHLARVRLITRWRCALSASALLPAPAVAKPVGGRALRLRTQRPPLLSPPRTKPTNEDGASTGISGSLQQQPALRAIRPSIDAVKVAVGDVVVELQRLRGGPVRLQAARMHAPPAEPFRSPFTCTGWSEWAWWEDWMAPPPATSSAQQVSGRGAQPLSFFEAEGWQARLRNYSWHASEGWARNGRWASRRPPATDGPTDFAEARTPAYGWRVLSYAVSTRLAVVIAREVEGALFWQLQELG